MTLLLLALAGCHDDDPALDRYASALQAYDEGRAKLTAGDAPGAVASFDAALAADPEGVPLALWRAKAQADAGDLAGAIAGLDTLLAAHPGASPGWYNRAAYKARLGDRTGAARDLAVALQAGVATPFQAVMDPDFATLRGAPDAVGLLPSAPVEAFAAGPEGAVFIGGQVEVTLTLRGVADPLPSVRAVATDTACLSLRRVVEDDRLQGAVQWRALTLRFEPSGPCTATVGPFEVTTGGLASRTDPVTVVVEAPPGAAPGAGGVLPGELPLPAALVDPAQDIAARRVGAGVAALGRPDRPVKAGGRVPDVALEWRVEGQTRATGGWWAATGPTELAAEGWSLRVE